MSVFAQKNRLVLWLTAILSLGFLSVSALGFIVARDNVRSGIVNQGLPLTADSVYSEVQRELLRPVFISAQMAENTFLRDWVMSGERDVSQVTRYLANVQTRFKTTSSFLISGLSNTY